MSKYKVNLWQNCLFFMVFMTACQSQNNIDNLGEIDNICSPKNSPTLTDKKIKKLNLDGESVTESGQLNKGEVIGYTFNGKAGDIFKYKTDKDICVDIYTYKNDLVKDVKLPIDGLYTLQVYLPKGSQLFEINFSLNNHQVVNNQSIENEVSSINNTLEQELKQFIINHYQELNARNYEKTWDELSNNFKGKSVNYSEYQKWWNSVREIKISDVNVISVNENNAIVNVKLSYILNNGKIFDDKKPYIYLINNSVTNNWMLDKKKSTLSINNKSSTTIDENEAINLIENLYSLLSKKQFDNIINFYSEELISQFLPDFFRQFEQVTVENLTVISQTNDTINLIGNNTYFYPNSSTQTEERSYQVMKVNDSLIITDSQFIKVTKFR